VDHLQQARGAEAQLNPAQERAERMAALARKVRENRAKRQGRDPETKNPEAVSQRSTGTDQGPPSRRTDPPRGDTIHGRHHATSGSAGFSR